LDHRRGALLVRRGKGGRRREVGMDEWAWEQLQPWLDTRAEFPDQLRHAHAVEMAHEGVPLIVIQRQLGHSNLGVTSIYPQGIDNAESIDAVHARHAPMIAVSTTLRL
jgi:integrase/recombinase XerD